MRSVVANIEIKSDPRRVLDAFTEFDLLKGWWGVERAIVQKRKGGVYALAWGISNAGFHYVSTGIIRTYVRARRLQISNFVYFNPERPVFGPMSLDVRVSRRQAGTALLLCQDGYGTGPDWDWYYEAVKAAWPEALRQLKDFLEKVP